MRRGNALGESPRSSICAFCAHRLGAPRAPRRLLSTSARLNISATSILRQNGGGFGRPAFGKPAFGGSTTPASGGSFAKPAFGSGKIELTEEEQRLRDALKSQAAKESEATAAAENKPRQFTINRGPGPQSSRAGRPNPQEHKEYQERARQSQEAQQRRAEIRDGSFRVFRPQVAAAAAATTPESAVAVDAKVDQQWGQLKRRNQAKHQDVEGTSDANTSQWSIRKSTDARRASADAPLLDNNADYQGATRTYKANANYSPIGQVGGPVMPEQPELAERALKLRQEEAERARELEARQLDRQTNRAKRMVSKDDEPSDRDFDSSSSGKPLTKHDRKRKDKDRNRVIDFTVEEDDSEAAAAIARAERKKQRKAEKAARKAAAATPILLPEYISVANLATALHVRINEFTEKMEELGFEEIDHNYILNGETAGLIAQEYGFEPIIDRSESEDLKARPSPEDPSVYPPRPPVVTIMGHVDHGKTTLLDYLRKSSVAAGEAGGITQHIGAFSVPMPSGKVITFLDTPGHAAFLNMRQRGANVTDIVVLVVAADDSVKPQTIEAINHAKNAGVPMIVALNKIDKEGANVDRVKQDLARNNVEIEDFGGDTQVVCVSGKTGQGMEDLEETIITLSDVMDMRADREGMAEGWVLEASIKSMGKVATILVRRGTMRPGDVIVAGKTWARIRCMRNEAGQEIQEAGPGTPVEIDGWREQPEAGDEVLQADNEGRAKDVVDYRIEMEEREALARDMEALNVERKALHEKRAKEKGKDLAGSPSIDEDPEMDIPVEEEGGPKHVYFIVKADVSGSAEAVSDSLLSIGNSEVQARVLRSGVGQVSEFDIEHAAVAKGYVISFNNTIDPAIRRRAENAGVRIIESNIIYRLVDEVKKCCENELPPLVVQKVKGEAEVAQIFDITIKGRKQKPIAGSKIRNGTIGKNDKYRVMRNGKKIFDGKLEALKNVKKDVMEMKKGGECGISFEGWHDFQVGDQIQAYEEIEEKRYL